MKNKKLFLFDIDGTIAVGDTLYEGSSKLLDKIRTLGGHSYFITNNSTRSGADYVKKFQDCFSLETLASDFVTSGTMTQMYLSSHFQNQLIYVLGTASYIAELRKNGLMITTELNPAIACVVVAYDSELTYEKLCLTSQILETTSVPFFATNPDLRCPIDFGFIPDCGAICHMLTDTCDREPVYLGKPSKEVVSYCQKISGFSDDETIVIGDRLYTDIACGINAGVDTAVVLTGEAKREDLLNTPYHPTYVYDTILDFYNAL